MPVSRTPSQPAGPRSRGQSSVMGVVLVTALAVMGVTGIMLFGASALEDARTQSELNAAEHAMTQLDSRFSLAALGSATRQGSTVQLRSGASMHVDGDRGWINVSVINQTDDDVELVVMNATLGAIVYQNDGTSIAYQGGGVWKRNPGKGSTMVSAPEFHYRNVGNDDPTLTLPLVVVRGNGTVSGHLNVGKETTVAEYPIDGDPDRSNPLTAGTVNVTVHSEYYEAWGSFFEDRTGATVTYDHDRERATISLRIKQDSPGVQGGIVSGAAGTTLAFDNNAETDSYNSSRGNYTATSGGNSSIIVAGDFELGNHGKVWGDLKAGGAVTLNNHANVTGDVTHGGGLTNHGTIMGTVEGGAEVEVPQAVDWLISDRIEAINGTNDNGDADVDVSGNRLQNCDTTCELDAGQYYLHEIDIDGSDKLRIDTSEGDVEIAVDGDANLGDATVEVAGDNRTRFYVEGDARLGGSGNVTTAAGDQRATGTWFYMNPGSEFEFGNGARFVGVVYGPGSAAQSGVFIDVINHVTIFGGIVGDIDEVDPHIDIHFDEALIDEKPLAGHATSQPTVTYLHVSTNRVNVTDR